MSKCQTLLSFINCIIIWKRNELSSYIRNLYAISLLYKKKVFYCVSFGFVLLQYDSFLYNIQPHVHLLPNAWLPFTFLIHGVKSKNCFIFAWKWPGKESHFSFFKSANGWSRCHILIRYFETFLFHVIV